jgi:flagellar L-ring protein precursor FlgH
MRRAASLLLALALLVAPALVPARAGSIWARANAGHRSVRLYEDFTARRVGDVLTIVINERSVIDNDISRTRDKKSDRESTAGGFVDLKDLWSSLSGKFEVPEVGVSSSSSSAFEGNAEYEADRSVVDQITVTVTDVLPNGNLVVAGARRRNVDGDVQVVQVSGIVRPLDITFENTVSSARVAQFHMAVGAAGPDTHFTHPGWFGRALNYVSPW